MQSPTLIAKGSWALQDDVENLLQENYWEASGEAFSFARKAIEGDVEAADSAGEKSHLSIKSQQLSGERERR